MNDWISVKDKLPVPDSFCLIWTNGRVESCYFMPSGEFAISFLYGVVVKYWMPAPKPPNDT